MNKFAAIDWDGEELRVAIGEANRSGLKKISCTAQPWDAAEKEGLEAGSFEAVARQAESLNVRGSRALLFARRQHLEGTILSAPPASDEELGDLVGNQIAVDFAGGADEPAFDFLPLSDNVDAPRQLAITAMDGEVAAEYRTLASELQLTRPRLTVRAAGIAPLVRNQWSESRRPTLVVIPNAEEIDLIVLDADRLWYWRSVYCSSAHQSDSFRDFVASEIVRTIAIAEENLPEGDAIERAAVLHGRADSPVVLDAVRTVVDIPVAEWPAEPDDAVDDLEIEYPGEGESAARFAPLIGAIIDEAEGQRPQIDLFNVREQPRETSSRRPLILGALAVATAVGLGFFLIDEQVKLQEARVDALSSELEELEDSLKRIGPDATAYRAVKAWNESHVVWLDELRDLSLRFPPPGAAALGEFNGSTAPGGRTVIRVSGKAVDPSVVSALDEQLRDDFRDVLSRNLREQAGAPDDPFVWRFESLINTQRRPPSQYRRLRPREAPPGPGNAL